MDFAGPEQTGGDDQGSGMSDSGSPRAGGDASAPARRRGGGGAGADGARNEQRILRRREINRNSQKRIRERRNMEISNLRTETQRLSSENEALLAQVESLTLARAEMLRQVQDLTDKWQQSIAENAWLNRENIQLRSAVQQMNTLLSSSAGTTALVGNATPASIASTLTAACRADGAPIPLLSPPAVASSSPLPVSMPPASRSDATQQGKGASCLPVPASALSSLASADGSFTRQVLAGGNAGVQAPGMLPGLPGLSSLGSLLGHHTAGNSLMQPQVAQAAD